MPEGGRMPPTPDIEVSVDIGKVAWFQTYCKFCAGGALRGPKKPKSNLLGPPGPRLDRPWEAPGAQRIQHFIEFSVLGVPRAAPQAPAGASGGHFGAIKKTPRAAVLNLQGFARRNPHLLWFG